MGRPQHQKHAHRARFQLSPRHHSIVSLPQAHPTFLSCIPYLPIPTPRIAIHWQPQLAQQCPARVKQTGRPSCVILATMATAHDRASLGAINSDERAIAWCNLTNCKTPWTSPNTMDATQAAVTSSFCALSAYVCFLVLVLQVIVLLT